MLYFWWQTPFDYTNDVAMEAGSHIRATNITVVCAGFGKASILISAVKHGISVAGHNFDEAHGLAPA